MLINDFMAAGYGVASLMKSQSTQIFGGIPYENGVKIVIGPGTGLGEAILIWDKTKQNYEPFPSEGGHADFAV